MELDAVVARYAADRFGVVTRAECLAFGMTPDRIAARTAAGLLVPVHRGVYRHAAAPASFEGDVRAAVLGAGPTGAASGPSAMRLFGIRGEWSADPEVTVVGSALPDLDGVHVRRIDHLRAGDVHRRFGIPVLAPPLALLLLGATEPPGRVENAAHDLVFLRLTTRAKLLEALVAYGGRGRRGTAAFRQAVRSLPDAGATQTRLKLDLLRLVRAHELPEPALQLVVAGHRLDLSWPRALLDVETDGDRWHLNPADRARDRARDATLQAAGWRVLRFGTADVHEHPARTVALIRASLSDRPPLGRSIGQRTA